MNYYMERSKLSRLSEPSVRETDRLAKAGSRVLAKLAAAGRYGPPSSVIAKLILRAFGLC